MSEHHSDPDTGEDGSCYAALANVFKEQGNEAFKDGDFDKAVKLYSQGIDIDPDNEFLFSNR
jgi:tetratricopeptide (TPR) repeat protein